jgi:hypothetical protein
MVIRIAEFAFLSLRKSLITSDALSVTVNINYPLSLMDFSIDVGNNLSIINVLSIIFFGKAVNG